MDELINRLLKGERPDLEEFIHSYGKMFDLLNRFEQTEQSAEWHGEGNVFIHTQLVLNGVYQILESAGEHLSPERKLSLIFAAVLHDIGKPLVTKTKEIDGVQKIVAPHHEERGCSYLAYRILDLPLPYYVIQQILRLVGSHHLPRQLVMHNASKGMYFQLARTVDIELLFYLAKADILGRICKEKQQQIDIIDLFRLYCEEHNLWGREDPYEEWKSFFLYRTGPFVPGKPRCCIGVCDPGL